MMKIWVGAVMIILVIIAVDITVIGWDRFVSGIGAFVDGYWHAEHLTKQPADIKNTPTDRGQTPKQPTQSLRGALPWPGEQAEHQAPRVGTPVAGQPEAWWRIKYDETQTFRRSCQVTPDGPRWSMYLADMEHRAYRMEDVTEQGEVVQTTMVSRERSPLVTEPPPLEGHLTWYRGQERCERALRAFREEAKREQQRREKYR